MNPPAVGALRVTRGVVFAGAAAWLAALAHIGGGGMTPSPIAVGLVAALCGAAGVYLSARRAGSVRLTLTLTPIQWAAHVLFTIFAGAGTHHVHAASGQGHSGHVHGTSPVVAAPPGAESLGARMPLAHLVAVVLTALLLAHGDRLVWRLSAWLGFVLLLVRPAWRSVGGCVRVPVWSPRTVVPFGREFWTAIGRRGPPHALGCSA